jgi:glucokinase
MGKTRGAENDWVLGIDVGGSKIASGLVDPAGGIRDRKVEETDQTSDPGAVEQLRRLIGEYDASSPVAVGIGVPGIADRETGVVWAPNVRGWDRIRLAELLDLTGELPVIVESDRNTAVLGEWAFGAARNRTDIVCLIVGTGIGAGVVAGGRLVRGRHEIAGAVGWIPVLFRGELRHFEDVAAGPGISGIAAAQGLPEDLRGLARLARREGGEARRLFDEVGDAIGQALGVLVSLLNPEMIVVGGGVANLWDLLEDSAGSAMKRWAQPIAVEKVEVVASRLGVDAGVLGAAAAARMEREE